MPEILLWYIVAHYLADFPLQGDFLARMKAKVGTDPMGVHALTAHSVIQAGLAAMVTLLYGYDWSVAFLVVFVTHWLIDFGKSWEKWPKGWGDSEKPGLYGIHADQFMHLVVLAFLAVGLAG